MKLAGLPITVCQVTSDAAKAIITHTEVHLSAHHSPDLFHVQHDTVQATGFALASRTRAAAAELEKAQRHTATMAPNPLSPVLEQHLQRAEAAENAARQQVRACQACQERAQAARQGLGRDIIPSISKRANR